MKCRVVRRALATIALSTSMWAAPAGERWTAYSKTAITINKDTTLSPDRITFSWAAIKNIIGRFPNIHFDHKQKIR